MTSPEPVRQWGVLDPDAQPHGVRVFLAETYARQWAHAHGGQVVHRDPGPWQHEDHTVVPGEQHRPPAPTP